MLWICQSFFALFLIWLITTPPFMCLRSKYIPEFMDHILKFSQNFKYSFGKTLDLSTAARTILNTFYFTTIAAFGYSALFAYLMYPYLFNISIPRTCHLTREHLFVGWVTFSTIVIGSTSNFILHGLSVSLFSVVENLLLQVIHTIRLYILKLYRVAEIFP